MGSRRDEIGTQVLETAHQPQEWEEWMQGWQEEWRQQSARWESEVFIVDSGERWDDSGSDECSVLEEMSWRRRGSRAKHST